MPQKDNEKERAILALAIGERIKARLIEKHLVGAYICRRLSVSPTSLTNWTSGRNIPDTYYLLELAEILEVSVLWLITGKKEGTAAERSEEMEKLKKEVARYKIELEKAAAKIEVLKELVSGKGG